MILTVDYNQRKQKKGQDVTHDLLPIKKIMVSSLLILVSIRPKYGVAFLAKVKFCLCPLLHGTNEGWITFS